MLIPFEYVKFHNIKEASLFLEEHKEDAHILAGGTDVIIKVRSKKLQPKYLVDIKGIKELGGIKRDDDTLTIGALTTVNEVAEHEYVKEYFPVLRDGAFTLGDYEIRNRATIGGNICNASPSADTVIPLLVYDAEVTIFSKDGERRERLDRFFKGPGKVNLAPGEILENIVLKIPKEPVKGKFFRVSRVEGMDLASLNMAILVLNPGDISKRKVRISIGAVAPIPLRIYELEEFLSNRPFDEQTFQKAKEVLLAHLNPREGSLRASPYYKKRMAVKYLSWLFEEI